MAAPPNWIKEHVFELLGTAIVGLLAFVGQEHLSALDKEVRETSCKVNTLGAKNQLEEFEVGFLGRPMDDLRIDSREMKNLKYLRDAISPLSSCSEGKTLAHDVGEMYSGLSEYVDHQYEFALQHFDNLPKDHAITQQLLGSANYRRGAQLDHSSPEYKIALERANRNSEQFLALANEEIGGLAKLPVITRYVCNTASRDTSSAETQTKAENCLNDLVAQNIADHNTYYNLAAIRARSNDFKASLEYLRKARLADRHHDITQNDLRVEPDFTNLSKSPEFHGEWEEVVKLFK
jgi:tetratricopeptide (TPR) repeat protein